MKFKIIFSFFLFFAFASVALFWWFIPKTQIKQNSPSNQILWQTYDQAFDQADAKPIFIVIGAKWCFPCQQMSKEVFQSNSWAQKINHSTIPIHLDLDQKEEIKCGQQKLSVSKCLTQVWMKNQAVGIPTLLLLDHKQNVLDKHLGYTSLEAFNQFWNSLIKQSLISEAPREHHH